MAWGCGRTSSCAPRLTGQYASMEQDKDLTAGNIEAIIQVHQELGPGFREVIYQNALVLESQSKGMRVQQETEILITYLDQVVGVHRIDLIVNGSIVVEIKAVEALAGVHYAQIRSYSKSARLRIGVLVNFASTRADFRRVDIG